ncbi:MAG: hypothetical protein R3202_14800, partial [Candidatus Competibacterales bacterium]|nr:hypothetical protein [Candidatus Competibacterales bacterium]
YMLINGDEWAETSEQQKALVRTTCTAATLMGLSEGEWKNGKVLAEFQERGVENDLIPTEVLERLKQVTNEVLEEEAARDEDFKRVWESQKEFLGTYTIWDKRAYLPSELY